MSSYLTFLTFYIKDVRVTKVSARSIPEVRGKLAFLSTYGIDCIYDAVATE